MRHQGLAIRLPKSARPVVAGCFFPWEDCGSSEPGDFDIATTVAAAVAWAADHHRAANRRLNTRVSHLIAERDMLKNSHVEALAAAIEERESRLQEQELHMKQLRAVSLQNEMILNSAGEGILGGDADGRLVFVNPAAARMLGYETHELIGLPGHETFHHSKPNGEPLLKAECPACCTVAGTVGSSTNSDCYWRKDGTSFPVEYMCTPIRANGKILGAVVTFQDISERRLLETRLRQAQKMESIGQLAAGIAHEINTPTQYIGDNTRFLEDVFGGLGAILVACQELREASHADNVSGSLVQRVADAVDAADVDYLLQEIPRAIAPIPGGECAAWRRLSAR